MESLPRISVDAFKAQLHQHVEEFAERMVEEMNRARPGQLIRDTEEGVRVLIHELGRAAYTAALQQKVDAAEAAFPPSAGSRERKAVPE